VHVHVRPHHIGGPHHQADVKTVMLKFVIEVRLKCIKITTTKKRSSLFTVQKIVEAHQNSAHTAEIG